MDKFIDGEYVLLRRWRRSRSSRIGRYLHADEDWRGVSIRASNASMNAVWRVHHYPTQRGIVLLLQGVAYGRYLGVTVVEAEARPGHSGFRTEQRDFNDPYESIRWFVIDIEGTSPRLYLLSIPNHLYLRADGYQRDTGVTVEPLMITTNHRRRMYSWSVQPVPHATINPLLRRYSWTVELPADRIPSLQNVEEEGSREIRYMRVLPDGRPLDVDMVVFRFAGRSLSNLRNHVAPFLGDGVMYNMFIQAGFRARPAPLVVDLPISSDPLTILITVDRLPGENLLGTGQQAQQNKPATVTDNVHSDAGSSQSAVTPVSGHISVDINLEDAISTEVVIREAQQNEPDTVTNDVHSDSGSSQSAVTPVSGHISVEINKEASTSTEGDIRAGCLGAKDVIDSILPKAMDAIHLEAE